MSYIPKDAVTQAFRSNKGVLTPNQIIELDNENKFTKYGQLELLITNASISSASTVDFTGLDTYGNFNVFFVTFTDLTIANDNKRIGLELLSNGTASGTNYKAGGQAMEVDGTFTEARSTSLPGLRITDNIGSATNENANGYIYIYIVSGSILYIDGGIARVEYIYIYILFIYLRQYTFTSILIYIYPIRVLIIFGIP